MAQSVRRFATSRRAQDVIAAAAVSHAFARGRGDEVRLVQDVDGIRIVNLRGDPLVYLDESRARDLGRWRVGVIGDDIREGSPAFCRSGEGHPVWGRDLCLDKGFGLGAYRDYRWGRTSDVGRIVFPGGGLATNLIGSALESVIGTSAYNRLALHAVTLGLVEPLTGYWVPDDTGPRVLMVNSGGLPVAEFVDVNRDNSVDKLLVALRAW
jgi:hypothetical protein